MELLVWLDLEIAIQLERQEQRRLVATSTGTLTLPGTIYKTDNSQTYVAATGQNIDITGDGATFTTTNDNIAFNTAGVDLSFDGEGEDVVTTIDTGTGAGTVTLEERLRVVEEMMMF